MCCLHIFRTTVSRGVTIRRDRAKKVERATRAAAGTAGEFFLLLCEFYLCHSRFVGAWQGDTRSNTVTIDYGHGPRSQE